MNNIDELVRLVAQALPVVDANSTEPVISPKGHEYLPGLPSLAERDVVPQVMDHMLTSKSSWLRVNSYEHEVPYSKVKGAPGSKVRCDAVANVDLLGQPNQDWAVEFKRVSLIGDNGKNNDYGPSKLISPYLKDHSLRHDAYRLRHSNLGRRRFIIGYSFRHSFALCDRAERLHPEQEERIRHMRAVCKRNDPDSGAINPEPMVQIATTILQGAGLVVAHAQVPFFDAWRHPSGGNGLVFGWEVRH